MKDIFIAAALRTAVVPKGGAFSQIEVASLAAEVIWKLAEQLPRDEDLRLEVVLGNALYGGGNPARVAALAARLPEHVPSLTLDTQCCSGLDAIHQLRSLTHRKWRCRCCHCWWFGKLQPCAAAIQAAKRARKPAGILFTATIYSMGGPRSRPHRVRGATCSRPTYHAKCTGRVRHQFPS
jgi:hypothetical protein